jgi:hypothetical protein
MERLPRPSPTVLAGLAVLGVTLAVYAGTLSHDFVRWDDNLTIYENPNLGDLGLDTLAWAFTDVATTMRWIPLTLLSLSLTHTFHGLDPFGYHLGNWLLHGAAAVLLFLCLRELLGLASRRRGGDPGGTWVLASAAAGALAWSLHPLRVEVVAWSNSRGHAQAAFFLLLSLLAYLRAHRGLGPPRRTWPGTALAAAAFLAALLSHPFAIGATPLFLLLDVYLGRLGGPGGWWSPPARRVLLEKLPFAAVAASVLAVTLTVRVLRPGIWDPPVPLSTWGVFPRIMQAAFACSHYLQVMLWPARLHPAPPDLIDFDPWSTPFLLRAALVAAISAAALLARRRWPLAPTLWIACVGLMVPGLGLTEHPMFACDRYTNLPSLVPATLFGAAVLWLGSTPVRRRAVALSAAALLALLGGLAHAQARTWKDSVTLFEHMLPLLGEHPFRVGIFASLGSAYLEQGRYAEAVAPLRQAALFLPDEVAVRGNLGYALWMSGRPAEAIALLEASVRLAPARLDVRCQLAAALADAGRPEDARREALTVLRYSPGAPCALQVMHALDDRPRP